MKQALSIYLEKTRQNNDLRTMLNQNIETNTTPQSSIAIKQS